MKLVYVAITSLLAGCASVGVQRLQPNLTSPTGAPGLIYYMPAPYLIVAELPPTAATTSTSRNLAAMQNPPEGAALPAPAPPPGAPPKVAHGPGFKPPGGGAGAGGGGAGGAGAGGGKDGSASQDQSSANGASSPAPSSDTSFQGTTPQYIIKLVYLPDLSRPMAMTAKVGLGSAEMKPALQDGWMLASLDVTADSKTADTLTALGSLITGGAGGGTAKAATTAAKAAPGGGPAEGETKTPKSLSGLFVPGSHILKPGLYRFEYDTTTGILQGLKEITAFSGCGALSPAEFAALIKSGSTDCP